MVDAVTGLLVSTAGLRQNSGLTMDLEVRQSILQESIASVEQGSAFSKAVRSLYMSIRKIKPTLW